MLMDFPRGRRESRQIPILPGNTWKKKKIWILIWCKKPSRSQSVMGIMSVFENRHKLCHRTYNSVNQSCTLNNYFFPFRKKCIMSRILPIMFYLSFIHFLICPLPPPKLKNTVKKSWLWSSMDGLRTLKHFGFFIFS